MCCSILGTPVSTYKHPLYKWHQTLSDHTCISYICHTADVVYVPRDTDRQEYVMNDVGVIYNGEFNNITSRSWNYGQVGGFLEMFLNEETNVLTLMVDYST